MGDGGSSKGIGWRTRKALQIIEHMYFMIFGVVGAMRDRITRGQQQQKIEKMENPTLSAFINQNVESITREWERFAVTLSPAADGMTHLALRDHIKWILSFIATDMDSVQSANEQKEKSQGNTDSGSPSHVGSIHGGLRFGDGFDIIQMVSEFRALRASIINLWGKQVRTPHDNLEDLTRFNESIDQLLAESLKTFMQRLDHSRDLFLGILGHDIRNPLGAIKMSGELIPLKGTLNETQVVLASQIVSSSLRINEIIGDLLDLTRARVGAELPIHRTSINVGIIAVQLVTEMRVQTPGREIVLEITGETEGEWDGIRLGQVFSNLIGNAVQYSPAESAITVKVRGESDGIEISVHNYGNPIPVTALGTIFDFLVRGKETDTEHNLETSMHMGLGLYIVKQILLAHGGRIDVTSSAEEGTTFTATFPRKPMENTGAPGRT